LIDDDEGVRLAAAKVIAKWTNSQVHASR